MNFEKTPYDNESYPKRYSDTFLVKILVVGGFLAISCAIFLGSSPTLAYSPPFSDDFESYNLGSLGGQNGWSGSDDTAVVNDKKHSGIKSIKLFNQTVAERNFDISTNGIFSFWIYANATSDLQLINLSLPSGENVVSLGYGITDSCSSTCPFNYYDESWKKYTDFQLNEWYNVQVDWFTSSDVFYWSFSFNFEGWHSPITLSPAFSYISKFKMRGDGNDSRLDDISGEVSPDIFGLTPRLTPTFPPDCQFNTTTSPISFNATGTIEISFDDWRQYSGITLIAQDWFGTSTLYFATSFSPFLEAGETGEYNIPVNLPDSAWNISYFISGHDFIYYVDVVEFYNCQPPLTPTGIGTQFPSYEYATSECPQITIIENCDSYESFTDKLLCNIKETLRGIFLTSCEKSVELKNTINLFTTKAPINYLISSKTFFTDVKNGISSSTELSLTFWGHSATTSFEIFNATGTVAGTTNSFKEIVRKLFSIILTLLIIGYFLNYLKRVWK